MCCMGRRAWRSRRSSGPVAGCPPHLRRPRPRPPKSRRQLPCLRRRRLRCRRLLRRRWCSARRPLPRDRRPGPRPPLRHRRLLGRRSGSHSPPPATSNGPFSSSTGVFLTGHTQYIFSVAWSPDGKTLASGSEDTDIRLWSAGGQLLGVLRGHDESVRQLAWSPDGKILASGAKDTTVRLWDAAGKERHPDWA